MRELGWALVLALAACGGEPPSWDQVEREIREGWPDVPRMGTAELARRRDAGQRLVLVDVRSREEFAVSRLPGARWAEDGAGLPAALGDLAGVDAVVVYCSVGYRSAAVAQRLGAAVDGVPVYNLEGSLFRWANEGRPLEGDAGPTALVHPFDAEWGALLAPEHRARPGAGGDQ